MSDIEDSIAIIGGACRVPGANDLDALWHNLISGVDAIRTYTDAELRAAGVDEALLADPRYVRAAGHLDGIDLFDAEFFGYEPAEAALIDPQHRLFLEEAWTALERAGHAPGGDVGVFAGAAHNRYFLFHLLNNPAAWPPDGKVDPESRLLAGFAPDHLPARVSYKLGLTGPSVAVQTTCSSSLVAVCLAAQSLLDYRCDIALAGGVSVAAPTAAGYLSTEDGLRSPDGRCRAFDAAASGSAPASAVGVVVLRRLADALADGDHVAAVIRGWAVNNDGGARAKYAAPGLAGQTAVVAEALAVAEIEPGTVGYVEAHGSGTLLGDAVEVEALTRVLGEGRPAGSCLLGSVKTNLGNADAAAGVLGLLKAATAVRTGRVPGSLHFRNPNPDIDFDSGPFRVHTATAGWPIDGVRRAGVSSFGQGGTNAHVVVEQPPAVAASPEHDGPVALPLSAATPEALSALVDATRDHLERHPEVRLADVGHTLTVGRHRFEHRTSVVADDVPGAIAALAAWTPGTSTVEPSGPTSGRRIPLPTYPFQRRRHWIDRAGGLR
jgi:phthiocerol/phenolphthiocerol synthesis type-I polyketide synthase E